MPRGDQPHKISLLIRFGADTLSTSRAKRRLTFKTLGGMSEFLERVSGVLGFGRTGWPNQDAASSESGSVAKGKDG
jgi:hypothetical protein